MKKTKFSKKLELNKKSISDLNAIVGGAPDTGAHAFTSGCTDGCGTIKTWWNCTLHDCTADCDTFFCDTESFCTH